MDNTQEAANVPGQDNAQEKVCSLEYFCEMCDYYPLYPVHGHYECPQCYYKTKCCEGMPLNE